MKSDKILRSEDKYKLAVGLVKNDFNSVLDVGCRNKILKKYLPANIQYQGLDLEADEEIIKNDLEKGIPLRDKSFDIVFALDILEHLDNIEFVFQELMRVAKKGVIISLPNMFFWVFRIKFLFGFLSHHYDFYYPSAGYRHKWLPSYYSAVDFIKHNTKDYEVETGYFIYSHQTLKFMDKIDKFFSQFFPGLFTAGFLFSINLEKKTQKNND